MCDVGQKWDLIYSNLVTDSSLRKCIYHRNVDEDRLITFLTFNFQIDVIVCVFCTL